MKQTCHAVSKSDNPLDFELKNCSVGDYVKYFIVLLFITPVIYIGCLLIGTPLFILEKIGGLKNKR